VTRVLITGMSGTGKSTLLGELAARGYRTVDTDYGDYYETLDGERLWREDRIRALLATEGTLFVQGTARNQGAFYPFFEHIVLLSAPAKVLVERLATRVNNPYGKDPEAPATVFVSLGVAWVLENTNRLLAQSRRDVIGSVLIFRTCHPRSLSQVTAASRL
jgi:adenylate kinase family enzyme